MLSIAEELVRRAALVLLLARVFLLTTAGELISLKRHTPRRSPARRRRPQPWGLEARQIRRVGGRLVAFRLQLVIV